MLVHFNSTTSGQPASRAVRTVSSICASVAMPVEMIIGLPVRATLRISGRSVFSNEAILKAGTPSESRKSTAVSSNGELKQCRPCVAARAMIGACHSQGVWASS